MKFTKRFTLILALVAVAIGIGLYIYSTIFFQERLHVLVITLALCCLGVILGYIVTRPGMQAVSIGLLILGIGAIGVSIYLLHTFQIHERAYTILGIGILCVLSSLAGIFTQSIIATLLGIVMLGLVAFSIGFNLASLDYHRRAYVVLGLGAFGILCGLIGIIMIQVKSRAASKSSSST
jgi:hypothetical protein